MQRGIDVSHHNGTVPWRALAAKHDLAFAFVKATEGETFVDPMFLHNWEALASTGLVRGAYHFARPDADARNDAARFVALLRTSGMRPTDLVALDLEVGAPAGVSLHGWATQWATEVRRLLPGYSVGLYHSHKVTGFDWWWYAQWPGSTAWPTSVPLVPREGHPDFWQFTDRLDGSLDAEVFNGTLADLRALNPGATNTGDTMTLTAADLAAIRKIVQEETWEKETSTVWQEDGTKDPAHPVRLTVGAVLNEARGFAARAAAKP